MRARSLKRQRLMRVYIGMIDRHLRENPDCARCGQPATCIHHRRGRYGQRLIDTRYWASSCAGCNDWAETHTGDALVTGWLLPIEGNCEVVVRD